MSSNASIEPSCRPIFIIGAPRSGTSIMTWAVGQHPNIQPMPETAWIAASAVGTFLTHQAGSDRGKFSHLSNVNYDLATVFGTFGASVDAIVNDAFNRRCIDLYGPDGAPNEHQKQTHPMLVRRSADEPKTRWIDGTPLNTFYTWALKQMFPQARFLHHLRQPHEVVASLEKFDRVGADAMDHEPALNTWLNHTRMAWEAERAFGSESVFVVDFKRLEKDPNQLLTDVCAFLGEPFDAQCLDPLDKRLNSSRTHDGADAILEHLEPLELYSEAKSLYDTILAAERPLMGENPDAHDAIKAQFEMLAAGRTLIGG